mmetsp:Transcript_5182/g.4750  ORF Transcript_5182/g.4750 Transcript_5182/m.4750 type:complete len:128 (+) Transcript_5182:340-723(+)
MNNCIEVVKCLKEARVKSTPSDNGTTPLIMASKNGNLEVAQYLVEEMGALPDEAKDQAQKITPLSVAIQKGNWEVADYLISKNCKVQPVMLYLICKYNNIPFLEKMMKLVCNRTGLKEGELINKKYE